MSNPDFKKEFVETHVTALVKKVLQDTHKLDVYAEDALLSLTYSDDFSPSPFLQAVKYDDKEAVGRMLMDRIYSLVESDVINKLNDDAEAALAIVARYEEDTDGRSDF